MVLKTFSQLLSFSCKVLKYRCIPSALLFVRSLPFFVLYKINLIEVNLTVLKGPYGGFKVLNLTKGFWVYVILLALVNI